MAVSDFVTTSRSPRRSRNSSAEACGNFGAWPNPPAAGSNACRRRGAASARSCGCIIASDVGILERFALHHVAPVTRRVADRHEQRLVLVTCQPQRVLGPRLPRNRVVLVLEEVRGGLVG